MSFPVLFGPNGEPGSSKYQWKKYPYEDVPYEDMTSYNTSVSQNYPNLSINYSDEFEYLGSDKYYKLRNAHSISVDCSNANPNSFDGLKGHYIGRADYWFYLYYIDTNAQITYSESSIYPYSKTWFIPAQQVRRIRSSNYSVVESDNRSAYPDEGDLDGFYYEYLGEIPSYFHGNGYGVLSDAVNCIHSPVLNGECEVVLQYPEDGIHSEELQDDSIIVCRTSPTNDPQPFRIYRHTSPMSGVVTWYARHLAYDMMGNVVTPFTASSVATALSGLASHSVPELGFELSTDKSTAAAFEVKVPTPLWSALGGSEGSILDVYGGEYEFNGNRIILHNRLGADRGVSIRYGVNLTDKEMDRNISEVFTAVIPYWTGGEQTVTGNRVDVSGTWARTRIMPLDLSGEFETAPTNEQLTTAAQNYIASHEIGVPKVSWKISFVMLSQTEEYKNQAFLERIELGDTVHVVFDKQGIEATARAVSYEWNVLLDRYDSVTLGSVKANMASTVAAQDKAIAEKPSVSLTEKIAGDLAKAFTGLLGGSVRILDTNGDGMPDELYIADNPDPTLAQKVWRWNYQGLAASKNGYKGDFITGMTIENGIMTWLMTAVEIVASHIHNEDKTFEIDLDGGVMQVISTKRYSASEYTADDGTTAFKIYAGLVVPTADQIAKYDLNGDGAVSSLIECNQVATFSQYHQYLDVTWILGIDQSDDGNISSFRIIKRTSLDGGTPVDAEVMAAGGGALVVKSLIADYAYANQLNIENSNFKCMTSDKGSIEIKDVQGQSGFRKVYIDQNGIYTLNGATISVNGNSVVTKSIIGYVVSASGTSGYPVANFYPVGFSGTYMISSDDWYIRFTLNTEQGTAIKTAGSSGTSIDSVTAVYN